MKSLAVIFVDHLDAGLSFVILDPRGLKIWREEMNKKTMILVFALVVGSWLVLASCGGGGSTPATTTTTTTITTTTTTVPAGFYSVSGSVARGSVEAGVSKEVYVLLINDWDSDPLVSSPAIQTVTLEAAASAVSYQLLLPVTQEGYYWILAAADFVDDNPRYLDVYDWNGDYSSLESTVSLEVTQNFTGRNLNLRGPFDYED